MKEEIARLFEKEKVDGTQKPLVIFDIANNHNGDINHGLKVIREIHKAIQEFKEDFVFGFKFQYRDLDTFIHPDYRNRMDIKYVKRFSETRLSEEDFKLMKAELDELGFISICTPFDEKSVEKIVEHGFDIIKIASCSFTDWPLLEKIVDTDLPIIASTASYELDEIDKIVLFLNIGRRILLLCIALESILLKKKICS